jgi:hypothetical protein
MTLHWKGYLAAKSALRSLSESGRLKEEYDFIRFQLMSCKSELPVD